VKFELLDAVSQVSKTEEKEGGEPFNGDPPSIRRPWAAKLFCKPDDLNFGAHPDSRERSLLGNLDL
jgi:hypothetical protein